MLWRMVLEESYLELCQVKWNNICWMKPYNNCVCRGCWMRPQPHSIYEWMKNKFSYDDRVSFVSQYFTESLMVFAFNCSTVRFHLCTHSLWISLSVTYLWFFANTFVRFHVCDDNWSSNKTENICNFHCWCVTLSMCSVCWANLVRSKIEMCCSFYGKY